MGDGESTAPTQFPTYAELTQTLGWATAASEPIRSAITEPVERLPGAELGRYTERALLGAGGMGKVMLAHDARVGREVALKQLHDEHELSSAEHQRFLREARVQGQLEHPSIVPVYDIDQRPDGSVFFTMRRVLGRTLATIIEELRLGTARYTQRELLTAFGTICLTIEYAHRRGVVHRDLKPANVMLGEFGEVYVLDWGLARILEEDPAPGGTPSQRISHTGALLGTPLYMAPEQFSDPRVGPAADVFGLGAILFELLTFERLRDAHTLYTPAEARPSVRAPERGIAPELEAICVRATESDPADRYASPRELQEAVARYLEGDQDREQRRRLAAHHATRARDALERAASASNDRFEAERGDALRELTRAVALDPATQAHVAALAATVALPPREVPAEVRAEMREETVRIVREGMRQSTLGMASWLLFAPLLVYIGVTNRTMFLVAVVAVLVSGSLSLVGWIQKSTGRALQISTFLATLVAAMMTSRFYGPLVLTPALIVSYTITMQSHPWSKFRSIALVAGVLATLLPVIGELAGVLPSSYVFEGGRMYIREQALSLPRGATILFLSLANVTIMIVPCLFIAQLRRSLSDVQARQLLQKWQFRRLGDELVQQARGG